MMPSLQQASHSAKKESYKVQYKIAMHRVYGMKVLSTDETDILCPGV